MGQVGGRGRRHLSRTPLRSPTLRCPSSVVLPPSPHNAAHDAGNAVLSTLLEAKLQLVMELTSGRRARIVPYPIDISNSFNSALSLLVHTRPDAYPSLMKLILGI